MTLSKNIQAASSSLRWVVQGMKNAYFVSLQISTKMQLKLLLMGNSPMKSRVTTSNVCWWMGWVEVFHKEDVFGAWSSDKQDVTKPPTPWLFPIYFQSISTHFVFLCFQPQNPSLSSQAPRLNSQTHYPQPQWSGPSPPATRTGSFTTCHHDSLRIPSLHTAVWDRHTSIPTPHLFYIQLSETDTLLILTPWLLYSFPVPHYSVTYALLYCVMRILTEHYSLIQ
jgi:hypothetical protein